MLIYSKTCQSQLEDFAYEFLIYEIVLLELHTKHAPLIHSSVSTRRCSPKIQKGPAVLGTGNNQNAGLPKVWGGPQNNCGYCSDSRARSL